MIKRKTVLILGAGASADRDFPVGLKLRNEVGVTLATDREGYPILQELGFDEELIRELRTKLIHTAYTSVDAFLERHPELVEMGKAAIACALIPYEREDELLVKDSIGERWYDFLWKRLTERSGKHIAHNELSIVTFNYDRSLEHYLWRGLTISNNLDDKEARQQLHHLRIIHLHGQLGPLQLLDGTGRPYTPDLTAINVKIAADSIKIVHEVEPDGEFRRAQRLLMKAHDIIFLGFGYLADNIERLGALPTADDNDTRRWFGSALGLGDGEKANLMPTFLDKIKFANRNDDCLETLKKFDVLV